MNTFLLSKRIDLGPGLGETQTELPKTSCKPECSSGHTHSQIHNHCLWTASHPHRTAIAAKLVLQIPCTPTLGTLYNQISFLPCIFKPNFLSFKHKNIFLYNHYLFTAEQKWFLGFVLFFCLLTRDWLNSKILSTLVFVSFIPGSVKYYSVLSNPDSSPCSPKYCFCQGGFHVFTPQKP